MYVIQHESHNTSIPHSERSCLLACDRSNRCIAFTHNSDTMSCTFYDILGPIELKAPDPVVLQVKSKTCIIPHVLDDEGQGGCEYLERPEQFVVEGVSAANRVNLTNATSVLDCSEECDRDGTCKMFDYDMETLTCRFYFAVSEWGVNTFYGGYVKSIPSCVYSTPTRAPTSSPTTAPSERNNTHIGVQVIDPRTRERISTLMVIFIVIVVVMCCGICFILCFKKRRHVENERAGFAIVGTIEIDLDYN